MSNSNRFSVFEDQENGDLVSTESEQTIYHSQPPAH